MPGDAGGAAVTEPAAVVGAFANEVRPHLAAMTALAYRWGPHGQHEDVVQAALLRAWQRWDDVDLAKGTVRSFLLAVVVDQARQARRRHLRTFLHPRDAVGLLQPPVPPTDALMVDIERAVAALPRRQRQAIELVYLLDLPVQEAAAVLGCSPGTVKSQLSKARAHLRPALEVRDA